MPKAPRMSDVAKLAGVSTMTVSRALNENASVTASTRERVLAAIEILRYKPNEVARSLRFQRSRQIGILVPNLYDPFFANCAHSIGIVAKEHNYSVVLATSDEDVETEFDEASRMMQRNVEGLVVIPAALGAGPSRLTESEFGHLPLVACDRPLSSGLFDSVLVQNRRGAELGCEHLIAHGHKRIAFFGLSRRLYTIRMRHSGYNAAIRAARLTPEAYFLSGNPQDTLSSLRTALSAQRPPTAIFCSNNLMSRQVLEGMRELHLQPPDPVALVGFDDFESADLIGPGITVVRQPLDTVGRVAADLLFSRLAHGADRLHGKRIVLPLELVVRGSCGAVPSKGTRETKSSFAAFGHRLVRVETPPAAD